MATAPLADVFWTAANKHLLTDAALARNPSEMKSRREYSCHAIDEAILGFKPWAEVNAATYGFIRSLGCRPNECGTETWDCWGGRQSIRYIWLLLAMHVAEDEKIMVEVP